MTTEEFISWIRNTVYVNVRAKVIALGYIPDKADYTNDQAGIADYQAAVNTIKTTKGFAIEVFGDSSQKDKGQLQFPRLTIEWKRFEPGDIALDAAPIYVDTVDLLAPGTLQKFSYLPMAQNQVFHISLYHENSSQQIALLAILSEALGARKYLTTYNDPDNKIFVEMIGQMENPRDNDNFREFIFMYKIPDLIIDNPVLLESNIQKITEINTTIEIQYKDIKTDENTFIVE